MPKPKIKVKRVKAWGVYNKLKHDIADHIFTTEFKAKTDFEYHLNELATSKETKLKISLNYKIIPITITYQT